MELENIKHLLSKYEAGETSLEEERELENYFSADEVPKEFEAHKWMFRFAAKERNYNMEAAAIKTPSTKKIIWSSIAAVLIVAFSLFLFNKPANLNENDLGTINDKEQALEKIRETLSLVSQYLNKGSKDLVYLKEFNNTTKKIIKID